MAITLQATLPPAAWLRSRSFELWFILGIAALALLSGAVVARPSLFPLVLFLGIGA
jgi:hypothetical protein